VPALDAGMSYIKLPARVGRAGRATHRAKNWLDGCSWSISYDGTRPWNRRKGEQSPRRHRCSFVGAGIAVEGPKGGPDWPGGRPMRDLGGLRCPCPRIYSTRAGLSSFCWGRYLLFVLEMVIWTDRVRRGD